MGWPVNVGAIRVWRNDRWARSWPFYNPPPAWVPGTSYLEGVVDSGEYLAGSTVTFGTRVDAEGNTLPAFYTCTTANADAVFDPANWTADPGAVGPPLDLTAYGDTVAGQLREHPDDPVLTDLDLAGTDLAGGQISAKFTAGMWLVLDAETTVGFDVEIRSASDLPLTVLVGKFSIAKDWTHDG